MHRITRRPCTGTGRNGMFCATGRAVEERAYEGSGARSGAPLTRTSRGDTPLLLLRKHGVFQLLRDACLDDRLCGDLDCFAGCRVAAHARLALLDHELDHAGKHELARAL